MHILEFFKNISPEEFEACIEEVSSWDKDKLSDYILERANTYPFLGILLGSWKKLYDRGKEEDQIASESSGKVFFAIIILSALIYLIEQKEGPLETTYPS